MDKKDVYMLAIRKGEGMYLLLTKAMSPWMDDHETCALSIIHQMYMQSLKLKNKLDFDIKVLKHAFAHDSDNEVLDSEFHEWLKCAINKDSIPAIIAGLVDLDTGLCIKMLELPFGTIGGIPLREEVIIFDYCVEDKVDKLRTTVISVINN